jgi:hypothetical protein
LNAIYVIAPVPVSGLSTSMLRRQALAFYLLGLLGGSGALAFALLLVPIRLPLVVAAAVAIVVSLISALTPIALPQSRWRVPSVWSQLGPRRYAGAFGVALGLGVVTALPSNGFYVLLFVGLSSESWLLILLALLLFGVARAVPVFASAGYADFTGINPASTTMTWRQISVWLGTVELVLLVLFAGGAS